MQLFPCCMQTLQGVASVKLCDVAVSLKRRFECSNFATSKNSAVTTYLDAAECDVSRKNQIDFSGPVGG